MALIRLQQINENKTSNSVVLRFGNTSNKTYKTGDKLGLFTILEISKDPKFGYNGSTDLSYIVISNGQDKYKVPYKGEFRINRDSTVLEFENSHWDAHRHLNKKVEKIK